MEQYRNDLLAMLSLNELRWRQLSVRKQFQLMLLIEVHWLEIFRKPMQLLLQLIRWELVRLLHYRSEQRDLCSFPQLLNEEFYHQLMISAELLLLPRRVEQCEQNLDFELTWMGNRTVIWEKKVSIERLTKLFHHRLVLLCFWLELRMFLSVVHCGVHRVRVSPP